MKRLVTAAFIVAVIASVASATSFPVTGSYLVGDRTTPTASGLVGTGAWTTGGKDGGIEISWNISQYTTGSMKGDWLYQYSFTETNGKTLLSDYVTHMLLEVSSSINSTNYSSVIFDQSSGITMTAPKAADLFSISPSIPSSFDSTNVIEISEPSCLNSFSFVSSHAPMWGSFYAVDECSSTYCYNSGIGGYPTSSSGPFTGWIPVPDTNTTGPGPGGVIPEPATMALFGLGLAGLLARRKTAKA